MRAFTASGGLRSAVTLVLAMLAACIAAAGTVREIVFVGCPIMRNTELPCWLGESGGELYYLGPQGDLTSDFYPPQFDHRMLVEGVVTDAARICGGVVLKPVKVSVLPEVDQTCNVTLPAMAYADPPHQRGPGPSGTRGVAPSPPPRPTPAIYQPPFTPQSFMVPFDVDGQRLWSAAQSAIQNAARYASSASAASIHVTGYRAALRLSGGQQYLEQPWLAQRRARVVEQALRTLDLPARTRLIVDWRSNPIASSGMDANARARHVSIVVTP
jgi:outer membrane protein OmpA-like peptidoglycan-associated protein